jgi:hypothetical protein
MHLAIAVVLVLVVAAAAGLLIYSQRTPASVATGTHRPSASPSSSPSPSSSATPPPGPFRFIGTRATDPIQLTIAELYPAQFNVDGTVVVKTAARRNKVCSLALVGASLQAAAKSAKCNQAVRATYFSARAKLMGTIGVLNLVSTAAAVRAGHKAGNSGYIKQLAGRRGPTHTIASGPGLEEAEVKGHYLILVWAGFSNKHALKTRKERKTIEHFMVEMITRTANLNLSTRMVTGSP